MAEKFFQFMDEVFLLLIRLSGENNNAKKDMIFKK